MKLNYLGEAKIASHVSDFEVALNAGTNKGITVGDQAILFKSTTISDPDSGAVLGSVQRPNATFRIHEVQERLCVAVTMEYVPNPSVRGSWGSAQQQKKVTPDPLEEDFRTVFVPPGAVVGLYRPVAEAGDEGSF